MSKNPVRFAVAAVAAGGGLGALARYELGLRYAHPLPAFPTTTLVINVTGSFALGLLLTLVLEFWPPTRYVRPFAAIGVLGGYTTFSTFTVDAVRLVQLHRTGTAIVYVAVSLFACVIAVYLGGVVAQAWPLLARRRRRA